MKEKYISTRGGQKNISASAGIIAGLATDGGLYVPSFIHDIHININDLINLTYSALAEKVFSLFLDDFTPEQIHHCVSQAYDSGLFEMDEPVSVKEVSDRFFLELYHGPTCAFKDMALTILPHLMTTSMKIQGIKKQILILTATSGDTGKAALAGFSDVPGIGIMVYYPKNGVSTIQEKQMLTQTGRNTRVIGVDGNFDDTQNGVKLIFSDTPFNQAMDQAGVLLSSANSINIGRLLPQIIYYFFSYVKLVKNGKIHPGDPINFVVPTGNFGNILAGYYASLIGLPVNRFICASNANNILTDFFKTGCYDRNRNFYKTMSPSMDILISSNLERLLFDLSGNNAPALAKLMTQLQNRGHYHVSSELFKKTTNLFSGGYASEKATAESIKEMYAQFHYLMDPHTAVANQVYETYRRQTGDSTPAVILSTASPYKFGHSVYQSIFGPIPEGLNDFDVLKSLADKTGVPIPKPLTNLDKKPDLHHTTCHKDQMAECISDFVREAKVNQ